MIYCSRCRKGPFNETQLNEEIFEYGDVRKPIRYCTTCVYLLRLRRPNEKKTNNLNENKIEEKKKVKEKQTKNDMLKNLLIKIKDNEIINIENVNDMPKIKIGKCGIYIVMCRDGMLFCGITKNLEKSIEYINRGAGNDITRSKEKRPVKLIYFSHTDDIRTANIKKNKIKRDFNI